MIPPRKRSPYGLQQLQQWRASPGSADSPGHDEHSEDEDDEAQLGTPQLGTPATPATPATPVTPEATRERLKTEEWSLAGRDMLGMVELVFRCLGGSIIFNASKLVISTKFAFIFVFYFGNA